MNFAVNIDSVLVELKHHKVLLRGLYEGKLRTVVAKYSSRLLTGNPVAAEDMKNKGSLETLFSKLPERASAAKAALAAVGSQMSTEDFAVGLDTTYANRNGESTSDKVYVTFDKVYAACVKAGQTSAISIAHNHVLISFPHLAHIAAEQHINSNEQLESEFKCLRNAGVVQLMEDEMPLECLIVKHYEVFMQLV